MASNFNNKYQKYGNDYTNNQNNRAKKTILAYQVPLLDPFKLPGATRKKDNPAYTDNLTYEQPNADPFKLYGQRLDTAHVHDPNMQYVYTKKSQMQRNSKETNHQKHRSVNNPSAMIHQPIEQFPYNVNNNNYSKNFATGKYQRTRNQYDDYHDNGTAQLLRPKSPISKRREPLGHDHYNQYFFYEYNRQFSPPEPRKQTNRKLPSLRMAANANRTLMNNNIRISARDNDEILQMNRARRIRDKQDYENQNSIDIHDFKGKLATNNNEAFLEDDAKIIPKSLIPEPEVIKGGGDYFDNVPAPVVVNGNPMKNDKPKKFDCTPYIPLQSRSSNYSLVGQENIANNIEIAEHVEKLEREENRKHSANPTSTKKPKGPRVLLYNTNSPRLQGKSSSLLLNGKGMSQHRFNESKRSMAMSPVRLNRIQVKEQIKPNTDPKPPTTMTFNGVVLAKNFNIKKSDESDTDFDDIDDDLHGSDFIASDDTESSSDAEEGYRSHTYRLIHPSDRMSSTQSYLSSQSSEGSIINPPSLLSPSLFPNVPPYLSFSSNQQKGPDVPPELHRILKWRVSNVMPKVVRCVLSNSGMRLVKKTNEWMGVWGRHMKSPCFKAIRPYQKINHLPGSFKIGRKDSCWRNLKKNMGKHSKRDFGFMPRTYIIPSDLHSLRKHWPRYAQQNVKWIIKPPASARGAGIRVINRWAQIPKRKPLIVQKYIERPLLINGSKFDLRLYVLVTSINPLRVFLYHNGLARFAAVKYSDRSETLNDRCMHLTNYSINKFSSHYSKNEDVNACHGHKWTLKSLWTYLANRGVRTEQLWEALRNLVLRTVLAGENTINNMIKYNVESKYSCYELFGFDVILDSELIPWLLEVNISPSLHSDLPLDSHVKAPLVQSVLNTALYNVPPKLTYEKQREIAEQMNYPYPGSICYDKRIYVRYLSRAEKLKHETFTRKGMEDRNEYINTILEHLTPDDVRCLIIAEDELARSGPLERIFPTNQTYRYLKYTENPRYYNRLLDAWEARYGNNRAAGIELLRKYCEVKYHLQVPPAPAKKDSNDKPPTNELANETSKTDDTTEETQS